MAFSRVYADEPSWGQGLVPARNFQPIQGLSLQMPAASAVPLRKHELAFRANVAETSIVLSGGTPTDFAVMKLNQLISEVDVRYGLNGTTELGLGIISIYNHAGALDGAIEAAEQLGAGRLAPPRDRLKDIGFAFSVFKNGSQALQGYNDTWSLSNIVLSTKTRLLEEGGAVPGLSIRTALKIPVGSSSRAFSTGQLDLGLGLAAQKMFWERVIFYLNLNEVFPVGQFIGYQLHPYFTTVGAAEFSVTPHFSVTTQVSYSQSPYRGTGIPSLDDGVPEFLVSAGYMFSSKLLWQAYAIEGFKPSSAPDFVLGTALTFYWRQEN
jgi:hypothetical protein